MTLLIKILIGITTTVAGAFVIWAVPFQIDHYDKVKTAVLNISTLKSSIDGYKRSASVLYADASDFIEFRDRTYYRWNESDIDRLRERQIRLMEKSGLSKIEKRWLSETENSLKDRIQMRTMLQERMSDHMGQADAVGARIAR